MADHGGRERAEAHWYHHRAAGVLDGGRAWRGFRRDGRSEDSGRFFVYDLETARYRTIGTPDPRVDLRFGVPWALHDGRHYLFSHNRTIVLLDAESGLEKPLLEPLPGSQYIDARMGAGNHSIFFNRLEEEADLWVAQRARAEDAGARPGISALLHGTGR